MAPSVALEEVVWEAAGTMVTRKALPPPGDGQTPAVLGLAGGGQELWRLVLRSGAAASLVTFARRRVGSPAGAGDGRALGTGTRPGTSEALAAAGGADPRGGQGGHRRRPRRRATGCCCCAAAWPALTVVRAA